MSLCCIIILSGAGTGTKKAASIGRKCGSQMKSHQLRQLGARSCEQGVTDADISADTSSYIFQTELVVISTCCEIVFQKQASFFFFRANRAAVTEL